MIDLVITWLILLGAAGLLFCVGEWVTDLIWPIDERSDNTQN